MKVKHWLSMVICCIPHSIIAILIGVGIVIGSAVGVSAIGFAGDNIMESGALLILMMGIACPVMMGLMMWMMSKGHTHGSSHDQARSTSERLAQLQRQRQQLEAEIAETKRIAELETQQQFLTSQTVAKGDVSQ